MPVMGAVYRIRSGQTDQSVWYVEFFNRENLLGNLMSANKTIIVSSEMPPALGPYSQAARVGNLGFVSGQAGLSPDTG